MREKVEALVSEAKRAAELIKGSEKIRVISHYDADGIASGAILVQALKRLGKSFHLTFLKQLRSEWIEELKAEENDLIVFLDLGSGCLQAISGLKTPVIVADHHQPQGQAEVVHLNPVLFGINEDLSGSGVAYLLARALSPENRDLSDLAIIGAIGDSQLGSVGPDWGLLGLNREILKDAVDAGRIKVKKGLRFWGRTTRPIHKALAYSIDPFIPGISGSESGAVQFLQDIGIPLKNDGVWRTLDSLSEAEQQKLATEIIKERIRGGEANPEWIFGDVYELLDKPIKDANEFATLLNACGKQKLAWLGLCFCLGIQPEDPMSILESYRREIGKALNLIMEKRPIKETKNAVYILAGDLVSEHVISNVTTILFRSYFTQKPIFSLVKTEEGDLKVSARGNGINLKEVLSEIASAVGGEGGGHEHAAGAVIPMEKQEAFIQLIENRLQILNGKNQNLDEVKNGGRKEKVEGKGLVRYLG
ncbi:MAG: hypothetical protein DRP12_03855 [Candidatus Aenigmatarchaeota archaeon]|nr:MAG: hypothetical protein DRP12_03855 [Candidatus Aenigmarchaeota archaeon]